MIKYYSKKETYNICKAFLEEKQKENSADLKTCLVEIFDELYNWKWQGGCFLLSKNCKSAKEGDIVYLDTESSNNGVIIVTTEKPKQFLFA